MTISYRETLLEALETAGVLQDAYWNPGLQNRRDGKSHMVTESDKKIEAKLRNFLGEKHPEHSVVGEEFEDSGVISTQPVWVIDPIDGTENYYKGIPSYTSALSVISPDGCIEAGGVVLPPLEELIIADSDGNSEHHLLNERKKWTPEVSSINTISEATIAIEDADRKTAPLRLDELGDWASQFLRFGAPSWGLANVALGRLDGAIVSNCNYYSLAAGVVLVRASGGTVTTPSGDEEWEQLRKDDIIVSNASIHDSLMDVYKEIVVSD